MKKTLDEFCDDWTRDKKTRSWSSLLAFNVENFTTLAGDYALKCFKESFDKGGFYGGSKWPPRESKWGKKHTHPILIDQGALKEGIGGERGKNRRSNDYTITDRQATRRYTYNICTTEISTAVPRKRGAHSKPPMNYAAVHNTDPQLTNFTVNQYSSKKPTQRQFIGHSKKMYDEIAALFVPEIFKDFPK